MRMNEGKKEGIKWYASLVVLRTSSLVQVKSQDYLAPQTINFFWSYVSVKVRAFFRSRFRGKQCWRQASEERILV
jgi:hypothetical protein